MWRADFLRCVQAERTSETEELQVSEDISETEREMPGDIFEEDSPRSNSLEVPGDDGPQMSGVVLPGPLASLGKGLAGIASGVPVDTGKVGGRELGEISTPNRARIQPPRLHLADQVRDAEGFPLHHADRARASANGPKSGVEPEVESADSGADAEYVIHVKKGLR